MEQSHYQRALEQFAAQDWGCALQSLNQAIAETPEAAAYYQRGKLRIKLQDFSGAVADYTIAIQLQPTAEAFLSRGVVQLSLDQPEAALADAYQALQLRDSWAAVSQLLGSTYRRLNRWNEAIAAYKQAAQQYLSQSDKEKAQFCISQIEQLQQMQQQASLLSVSGSSSATISSPDAFVQQVGLKLEQGQYRSALEDLNWLLNLYPRYAPALCQRGKVQAKLGNAAAAVQDLAQALQLEPDNREIRLERAIVRLILGDARGAVTDFSELLSQKNDDAQLYLQRGRAYRQLRQFEQAFKDYSNAIAIQPQNAELYSARAEVHQETSNLEEAIADYQHAMMLWFNQGNWSEHQQVQLKVSFLQTDLKQQAARKVICAPIKHRLPGGSPLIEVVFNEKYTFDMIVDTGASITMITSRMAQALQTNPTAYKWFMMADGHQVEYPVGWVQSIAVQRAERRFIEVAIGDREAVGLLGQDFLSYYDIRILAHEIEFHLRSD
jgi:tetratricopeptide (TPR) repeat protein